MTKPRLTYFDMSVSRGEECRLAFALAGVDFEDRRIARDTWAKLKPTMPFGALPVLEVEGHPPIAQSNAILVLIGRLYGVHPSDPYEAARHEAVMAHVEDLRALVGPSGRISDEAAKRAAREELARIAIPTWAGYVEAMLGDGPFFAGAKAHVVDIKLHIGMRGFRNGVMDFIPTTVFDGFPKLMRLYNAVGEHPAVKAWQAR
jgi:glutathione S-transferase